MHAARRCCEVRWVPHCSTPCGGRGGTLTSDDLESVRAEWTSAARGAAGSLPVWATPAPTHGASLLDAVAGFTGADAPVAVWDAVLAAIARQRTSLGDPAVPGSTSAVSAADAEGNAVVVVHSNSYPRFGSGIVVEGFDLVLNNRAGRGFTSVPGHPNFPVAGRRPATTLHAWAAGEVDGRPALVGATPGGVNQLPWNAQIVADVVAGELRPGVLVTLPRWEWLPAGDGAVVEEDLGAAATDALVCPCARAPSAGGPLGSAIVLPSGGRPAEGSCPGSGRRPANWRRGRGSLIPRRPT